MYLIAEQEGIQSRQRKKWNNWVLLAGLLVLLHPSTLPSYNKTTMRAAIRPAL